MKNLVESVNVHKQTCRCTSSLRDEYVSQTPPFRVRLMRVKSDARNCPSVHGPVFRLLGSRAKPQTLGRLLFKLQQERCPGPSHARALGRGAAWVPFPDKPPTHPGSCPHLPTSTHAVTAPRASRPAVSTNGSCKASDCLPQLC